MGPTICSYARNKLATLKTAGAVKDGITACLDYLNTDLENSEDPTTNKHSIVALLLLPYLIAHPTVKNKTTSTKYSRIDVVNDFILKVVSDSEILVQREQSRQSSLRIQPHIVYCGGTPLNPDKVFILVDQVCYEQPNIVTAVDTLFKIFMTTNCLYPQSCHDVWMLIQTGFFRIETKYDVPKNQTLSKLLRLFGLDSNSSR